MQLLEEFSKPAVERGQLVRVFPVTQSLRPRQVQAKALRQRFRGGRRRRQAVGFGQIRRNLTVVGGGAGKNALGQQAAEFRRGVPVGRDLRRHPGVIGRVNHHGHAFVVFGRAAQHGRTADINVFDRLCQGHAGPGDGFLEGIQVHHHQINRFDVMLARGGFMPGVAPHVKQSPVNARMEGFHPAIHHFGKSGVGA